MDGWWDTWRACEQMDNWLDVCVEGLAKKSIERQPDGGLDGWKDK